MHRNKLCLYVHLVWATWDRAPVIGPAIERSLHRNIESEAVEMGCTVIAIDGMPDHVHLLVQLPATITIANLVKQVKGVSSHFVNETLHPDGEFKWQGSYGAFTVSRWDVDKIAGYVKRQKEHHEMGDLLPEWEETVEEVTSDERHVPSWELPGACPNDRRPQEIRQRALYRRQRRRQLEGPALSARMVRNRPIL